MLRLLGFLVVLALIVGAIGYYRGWFHAESQATSGQSTITVTVDKDKVTQDKDAAQQKVQDLEHK
jgi:hypothetical protein